MHAYRASGDRARRAPTSATTCTGASPTGAQLAYDAERQLNNSVSDTASPPSSAPRATSRSTMSPRRPSQPIITRSPSPAEASPSKRCQTRPPMP
jgi:hypothetical protein